MPADRFSRFIPALPITLALVACAPTPPSGTVGRIIWSIRNPPPPTATPDVSDRLCAEAYAERGDELPGAFATQIAAADPATAIPDDIFFAAAEAATDELDIPQASFGVTTADLSGGGTLIATHWCDPYAGKDVFVVSGDRETWHLAHIPDGAASVSFWTGDNTAVVWASVPRALVRRQQVWIAEQGDEGWAVVYEAEHAAGPRSAIPAELTLEQGRATVEYTLESGEQVVRAFSLSPAGVWTMTDEQRTEADS